jgi:hypothetical protein
MCVENSASVSPLQKLEMFNVTSIPTYIFMMLSSERQRATASANRLEAAAIDTGAWSVDDSSLPIRLARETVL